MTRKLTNTATVIVAAASGSCFIFFFFVVVFYLSFVLASVSIRCGFLISPQRMDLLFNKKSIKWKNQEKGNPGIEIPCEDKRDKKRKRNDGFGASMDEKDWVLGS